MTIRCLQESAAHNSDSNAETERAAVELVQVISRRDQVPEQVISRRDQVPEQALWVRTQAE